ncbi:hypothetical protein CFOL_v3_13898 [Cephalotus follicularis]|uniref:Uncharacterized protein n=1 Tax=Cephalotus follicularis TaxID=3775 RepID=A0A1Q3BQV9_CEPFO|nr:hypothetical protein CFOL_v3_13898 [Cephalotus follicularis]
MSSIILKFRSLFFIFPQKTKNKKKKKQAFCFLQFSSDVSMVCFRYGSCATPQDFEMYAPDASFEDPLMCAIGLQQIKSAFYSLSKVFSECKIVEYSVKENEISPGKQEILIDNKQQYKFLGRNIDMISLIKLNVENGKIVRHEDWWDKKPLWNRETVKLPLAGRIMELTRRGSMLATHAMMRFGKDPNM